MEASKALESLMDEALAKINEELRSVKQVHQTAIMALQNEVEIHKAEIKRLQTEAETSLRQAAPSQSEIKRLESRKGDEERTSSLQEIQQMQYFIFLKLLII